MWDIADIFPFNNLMDMNLKELSFWYEGAVNKKEQRVKERFEIEAALRGISTDGQDF